MSRCPSCGFAVGDRAKMRSGLVDERGLPIGHVHGVVDTWHAGCDHIVTWNELPTVTALPNPNVEADGGRA